MESEVEKPWTAEGMVLERGFTWQGGPQLCTYDKCPCTFFLNLMPPSKEHPKGLLACQEPFVGVQRPVLSVVSAEHDHPQETDVLGEPKPKPI